MVGGRGGWGGSETKGRLNGFHHSQRVWRFLANEIIPWGNRMCQGGGREGEGTNGTNGESNSPDAPSPPSAPPSTPLCLNSAPRGSESPPGVSAVFRFASSAESGWKVTRFVFMTPFSFPHQKRDKALSLYLFIFFFWEIATRCSVKTRRWLCDDGDLARVGAPGAIVRQMQRRKYFVQEQQQRVVRVSSSHAAGSIYTEPNKHGQRVTCPTAVEPLQCGRRDELWGWERPHKTNWRRDEIPGKETAVQLLQGQCGDGNHIHSAVSIGWATNTI